MLSFRQWLILEDLNGVHLKPAKGGKNDSVHEWEMHHPQYGKLATVSLHSAEYHHKTDKMVPVRHARTAIMSIHSHENPSVPTSDVVHDTTAGPQYNVGHAATRKLLHHIAHQYPYLQTIKAQRVTGWRGDYHGNGTNGNSVVNVSRLRRDMPRPTLPPPPKTTQRKRQPHPGQHEFSFMHDHDDLPF